MLDVMVRVAVFAKNSLGAELSFRDARGSWKLR